MPLCMTFLMHFGCSGDCAAEDADSFDEFAGSGQGFFCPAPMAHKAKPVTINKTDKARFTAIIRFIIKRRKAPDSTRIVETAISLASFFRRKIGIFLRILPALGG